MSSNIALVKNATLHGVFWGSYMQHRPRVLRQSLEQLVAWLGEGRISIPIFHRRACSGLAAQCSRPGAHARHAAGVRSEADAVCAICCKLLLWLLLEGCVASYLRCHCLAARVHKHSPTGRWRASTVSLL